MNLQQNLWGKMFKIGNLKNIFSLPILQVRSPESMVLYISMLVMGACGIAYEYTFCKIASDLLGDSVRQWAIIIGIMMFFMGVGSDVQKYIGDRNIFDKFIVAEVCLGLAGGFGPVIMLFVFGSFPSHYILAQYFFIITIGLLIGFEIPLLTRINQTYTKELKLNLAGVLKMDYIGSLGGALLWVFWLPKFFIMTQTAFVLGAFNVFTACVTLVYFRKLISKKKAVASFSFASLALLIAGFTTAENFTSHAEQYLYRDKIVFSTTSSYQHIVITESRGRDIACYINGHLQFHSFDEHIYHENLIHPAFAIAPVRKNILVLGGGDGLAVREILKYPEVNSITLCDIDPMMTELAVQNPYFTALNQNSLKNSKLTILKNHALIPVGQEKIIVPNQIKPYQEKTGEVATVNIINLDAALFVEQISGLYDIIIIDFPDPNAPGLSKLYSKKFYSNIKKKLSATGIIVQQATSPVMAREAFLCIGRTMRDAGLSVIPYHDNVPSFGEWGWWIGGKETMSQKKAIREKIESVTRLDVSTKYLTAGLLKSSLEFGRNQLQTNQTAINTIMRSCVYDYYIKGWQQNY